MSELSVSVTLRAFDEVSSRFANIIQAGNRLSAKFDENKEKLKALNDQARKLQAFDTLKQKMNGTWQSLNQARERVRQLHEELQRGQAGRTAAEMNRLRQQYERARRSADSLERTYHGQQKRLTSLGGELRQAGVNTHQFASEQNRLRAEADRVRSAMERQQKILQKHQEIQQRTAKSKELWQKTRDVSTKVALGGAVALSVPIKASIDFESSMADVKKVVDFGDDPTIAAAGLKQMSDEIVKLSTIYPMAAKDIAAIVAAGGQSGIARQDLTAFATDAIKMGVAFDTTAEEAGQAMAEMRTAFAMNQTQVAELADKINYLGNTTPAAAKDILEITKRIGPLGEVGGLASGSIAALGATMRGMGIQNEMASTGIKNLMLALVKGEALSKSQKAAFEELGLSYTQVAQDMQTDSNAAIIGVLQSVAKLDKYKQASVLSELFGSESLTSIAPLLTQLDTLQANFKKVGDSSLYAGSMNAEYTARAATTANNLQLMKQKGEALAIQIGNTLLPTLNTAIGFISDIADRVTAWANAHPKLFSALAKGAAVVTVFAGGLALISTIMLGVLGPLALLQTTFATLSGAVGAVGVISRIGTAISWLGGIVRAVGLAMMTNPILLAIAAIAAAAYLIYANWGAVKAFFINLWNSLPAIVQSAISMMKTIIMSFSPVGIFVNLFGAVLSYLAGLGGQFSAYGANLIEGLKNGIMSRVGAVVSAISGVVAQVKSAFTGAKGMDIHSPSRVFASYGGYMMAGLNQGITGGAGNVVKSTAGVTDKIRAGLTNVSANTLNAGVSLGGGASGGASANTPANIVININGATDPQAVARAVQSELARVQASQLARERRRMMD